VIPRNPGKYDIPPVKFSYFDLGKKSYVNLQTAGFSIDVQKGSGESGSAYTSANKEDVKMLASDIRFIKTGKAHLRPFGAMFFQTSLFWILFVLPFLLFGIVILVWNRHMKLVSDKGLMKNRKATRVAQTRLKKAAGYLKTGAEEAFYVEVSQALWGYMSDKLYIPMVNLSQETVAQVLDEKNVDKDLRAKYRGVLEECEYIRFAPGDKAGKMEGLYSRALEVITRAEKEIS
jgi:hypothetical protein